MDKSLEHEPVAQSLPSKRDKRCVQSKLSWFLKPLNSEISTPSSSPSPQAAIKAAQNGAKYLEESTGKGKRRRNSRKRSLDGAFGKLADTNKRNDQNLRKRATKRTTDFSYAMQNTTLPDFDGDCFVSIPPVHVFEDLNDKCATPDWRSWTFLETNLDNLRSSYSLNNFSTFFEGSFEPSKIDCEDMHLNSFLSHEVMNPIVEATRSCKFFNGQSSKEQLSFNFEMVHQVGNNFSFSPAYITSVDEWDKSELHKRRLASYHQRIYSFPDCCLWTEKYRPENALEVCGNAKEVKFLSEWLKSRHENGSVKNKNWRNVENNCALCGNEHIMGETCGRNTLKSALLIAGPVGSGKSAAVYACAKEQGFKVIEVNASSLRNGAYLRQTFGEAVDSLGLIHWVIKNQVHQTWKLIQPEFGDHGEFDMNSNEVISEILNKVSATGGKNASDQVASKTLLLFEEVDIVFDEDHGFLSAILKLAETAKRPIILTSNNRKVVHPQLLERLLVLNFKAPSSQELFCYLSMVCDFEKVRVTCDLLERIISASFCDIRRILMLLQFWSRGIGDGPQIQCSKTYSPLDIDAVHSAIPKLIPWDFRCELAEKVENAISRTVLERCEKSLLMGQYGKHLFLNPKEVLHYMDRHQYYFDHSNSSSLGTKKKLELGYNLPIFRSSLISQVHEINGFLSVDQTKKVRLDSEVENSVNSFEGRSISHVCDTFGIQDVSCVPQSYLNSMDETNTKNPLFLSSFNILNGSIHLLPEKLISSSNGASFEISKFSENHASSTEAYSESVHGNDDLIDSKFGVEKYLLSQSHVMDDECSRAGYNVFPASKIITKCCMEAALVSETWRKLLSCRENLKLFLSPSSKDASLVTALTSHLTDLISKADNIYRSCNYILFESFGPTSSACFDSDFISCYEKQMEMGSAFSQHGICLYMKKCATFGSSFGCNNMTGFIQEIKASCIDFMAVKGLRSCMLVRREAFAELCEIVLPVVPLRLSIALKGGAFHEYLSFIMHISRMGYSL